MKNGLGFLMMAGAVMFASCSDDTHEDMGREVAFCVHAGWQDGFGEGRGARALSHTDLLADVTDAKIPIGYDDYPATISMHCSDDADFTLTKHGASCSSHSGYWGYTSSKVYKGNTIQSKDLTFTATAVIDDDGDDATTDDGDRLTGTATKDDIVGNHLQLTLRHTKALFRFSFKVAEKYDQIRFIKITNINFNGKDCYVKPVALTQAKQYVSYAYIDPQEVTVVTDNTLICTYDIYDKDARFDGTMPPAELATHRTRQNVQARNTFKLREIKKGDTPLTRLQGGYYYDMNATINPDFLYVLSEHDNKHLSVQ